MTTPDRLVDDVVAGFSAMDVCAISDALDALGVHAPQPVGIAPLWEGAQTTGRALTVQLELAPPPAGHEQVHLGARAIAAGTSSHVIVVANAGRTAMGAWGGLLSAAAQARGISGVVVDGACRDVDEQRVSRFPAFGLAPVMRTARGRVYESAFNVDIVLAGAVVRPDDVVRADASGVVVVPREVERDVLAKAQDLVRREAAMRRDLEAGADVIAVLGGAYEHMLVKETES
ncbi:RraA family protein [Nocardioides sp.]|uniref:RraA family protein n=1 Tax=Nocardioides sp. TaxID=35761 RepID=UPI003D145A2C